jgi:glycosyltransferase involved in cell wall biosynthesis
MQSVDVVVLTKNSAYLLDRCLSSVYRNVPVNQLIVVDGFSTDATLAILKKYSQIYGNVKVFSMNGSRAVARERGIKEVTTDWFMFVDSDVVLSEGWFRNAEKNVTDRTGAVWGVNIDVIPNVKNPHFFRFQAFVAAQCFSLRGGTHDVLIRRESVEGIRIPEELHTYEDAYIMNWIKRRGYEVTVGQGLYCLHYKPPENWRLENAVSQAILELKCGLIHSRNFAYALYYPVFMFYWFVQLAFHSANRLLA